MIESKTRKLVLSSLFLALGILLPFVTAHGLGIPGTVFLPMHIPVLLCGFFCGPLYGAICGISLPFLNSILTGMPVMYPNAIIMSTELFTYGLSSGGLYKIFRFKNKLANICFSLVISMISGRIISGFTASLLLLFNSDMAKYSVLGALVSGLPGIVIQLILIPSIVCSLNKNVKNYSDAKKEAINMIKNKSATCVVVKNNRIIVTASTQGISYLLDLYEKNMLEGAFIADTIIGKAASMIFSLGKINSCYGETMSYSALDWLNKNNISATYNTLVPMIENRAKTGCCPMENTVADITNSEDAYTALKEKLKSMNS